MRLDEVCCIKDFIQVYMGEHNLEGIVVVPNFVQSPKFGEDSCECKFMLCRANLVDVRQYEIDFVATISASYVTDFNVATRGDLDYLSPAWIRTWSECVKEAQKWLQTKTANSEKDS